MFEVFTEEIEVTIKDGIANLYWYRADLAKALIRSGVEQSFSNTLIGERDEEGKRISKRQMMDRVYEHLRARDYNKRLEISRNLVRILVEHTNFSPQNPKHRIDIAEKCALRLRQMIIVQQREREKNKVARQSSQEIKQESYHSRLSKLEERFNQATMLEPQRRGYELEGIFTELMRVSSIPVEEPFSIEGEQLDGAIKYDGIYYLVELKWRQAPIQPKDVGSFYFKVDGKMGARGLFISMNGFTDGVINSAPKGREIKVILLDGVHIANVVSGVYKFQELLDHAIKHASLRGNIFCPYQV